MLPASKLEWKMLGALLALYVAVDLLTRFFLPSWSDLHPAAAVALGVLYFGGLSLWMLLALAVFVSGALAGAETAPLIIDSVTVVLQAVAGAFLLRQWNIDPLFRKFRDVACLAAAALLIAVIAPAIEAMVALAGGAGTPSTASMQIYVAALFGFFVGTPFILRWFAKVRFNRTPIEIAETLAVFAALIGLEYAYFIGGIQTISGVPLLYVLLIPFFLIALRLRPRFVTLAIIITSAFAIGSVLSFADPGALATRLFETEVLLITLALVFYIIVSLEEDRRRSTNLLISQLGTLENAVARVSSESKAKNDFIAILGHELRNPLAPVVSGIETLRLNPKHDPLDAELLAVMENRMDTVRRLLDDLLDISKISEGKITLKREALELLPVLRRAVLSTSHHRNDLHQSLAFKEPAEPIHVLGDPVRIEQIVSNLLTNASKFSNSGDKITLRAGTKDGFAEIAVTDQGIGIEPGELKDIFHPFHQIGRGKRSQKGLGIGLALVKSFVEMQGGSVTVESGGNGKGSRFIVRLPLAASHIREETVHAAPIPARFSGSTSNSLVLVVDDNDVAAAGIGRLLELHGVSVAYAYTGASAIEKALELSPGTVLLDIGLPDMEGYSVARALRARGFSGRLIALTGYGTDEARGESRAAGFDHHLVKPVGIADLKRVLPGLA